MSAHDTTHNHGHDEHGDDGHVSHSTLKGYATGFALAVILTVIPFWLVMAKVFDKSSTTGMVLLAMGAVQIVVHMIYFLHMNTKSEHGWSMLALIFTVMVVVIMMSGSLWVMYHLNHNMMPGMMDTSVETKPESINTTPASTVLGMPQNTDGAKQMP